jgi:hypothetical protein
MRNVTAQLKALLAILAVICLCPPAAALAAEEVLNPDCTINEAVFEQRWKEYSDLDERIGMAERSWEAQMFAEACRKIGELEQESLRLQTEIIMNGQFRREVRELKKLLVTTLRNNLVKSLFRLSFLTADAVKTGFDAGGTYAELFTFKAVKTLPAALEKISKIVDVVSALSPEGSEAAEAVSGNAGDAQTVLESITASSDEVAVNLLGKVLSAAEEKAKEMFPSWDTVPLGPEDISILESQYLNNRALDAFLEESYEADRLRSARVRTDIPAEIQRLAEERDGWELKEKERVRAMLVDGCLKKKMSPTATPGPAAGGWWELAEVETVPLADGSDTERGMTRGGAFVKTYWWPRFGGGKELDFTITWSWAEPPTRLVPGESVAITLAISMSGRKCPFGVPGGWMCAGFEGSAFADPAGKWAPSVSARGLEIVQGSDYAVVSGRVPPKYSWTDKLVLYITCTQAGNAYYRYQWRVE